MEHYHKVDISRILRIFYFRVGSSLPPRFSHPRSFSHREKHVDEKSLIFLPATNSARQCKGDACGNLVAEEPIPELESVRDRNYRNITIFWFINEKSPRNSGFLRENFHLWP